MSKLYKEMIIKLIEKRCPVGDSLGKGVTLHNTSVVIEK